VVGHRRLIVASAVPLPQHAQHPRAFGGPGNGTLSFVDLYPALERQDGKAARALGVPGYSQSRLSALKANWDSIRIFPRFPISLDSIHIFHASDPRRSNPTLP
jgi:hypothetical protein